MTENYENRAEFVGTIEEQIEQESSYEIIQSERGLLHKIVLRIQRPRGKIDRIIVFADKEELRRHRIGKGLKVRVEGVIHTCNEYDNLEQKRHVIVYVRARKVRRVHTETLDVNKVVLTGNLTQTPKFWKFPNGGSQVNFDLRTKDLQEEITSFIPCVARDRMADILCEHAPWEELSFIGRFQSRDYIKTLETGLKQQKTAFEVVVEKLI